MLIQQGDVLIRSVSKMPKNLKKVERKARGFVLAEGEVTGHAHVIESDIDLMLDEASGKMFMHNDSEVTVKHEEHHHVDVPAGDWELGIVKEYDHFAEEARKVQD
jgi:hypothetical protein